MVLRSVLGHSMCVSVDMEPTQVPENTRNHRHTLGIFKDSVNFELVGKFSVNDHLRDSVTRWIFF